MEPKIFLPMSALHEANGLLHRPMHIRKTFIPMKILFSQMKIQVSAAAALLMLAATQILAQDFQRVYGTPLGNSFSKVLQDNAGKFYVLGQDEAVKGLSTNHPCWMLKN